MTDAENASTRLDTIESYNTHWQLYLQAMYPLKVNNFLTQWIDTVLSEINSNATIFEIGSGTGRDADYMEAHGYQVTRSDASLSAVQYQRGKGKPCVIFDVLEGSPGQLFDLVYANAVLLHLNPREFDCALYNIRSYLSDTGRLAIVMKRGQSCGWSDDKGMMRWFQYWSEDDLYARLTQAGFSAITIEPDPSGIWLHVRAKK